MNKNASLLPTDPDLQKACTHAQVQSVLKSKDLDSATHLVDWELMGGTLLTIDGPEHINRRRLQSPIFHPDSLRTYETEVLQNTIDTMLQRTAQTAQRSSDGKVHTDLVRLGRLVMLSISAAVIGLDDIGFGDRRERLGDCTDMLIEGILVEWVEPSRHEEVMDRARKWKRIFGDEFVFPSLERRRARLADADEATAPTHLDLLTILAGDSAGDWTDEAVLRECILYLVASTLTTSTAMTHTVVHLDEWFRAHPDERELSADADFLRSAAREALRLHPGPHILMRRAGRDGVEALPGAVLDEGDFVGADLRAANLDPEVFGADADRFDPHRVFPKGVSETGVTFGGGRHMCIGRPLALGTYGGPDAVGVDGILVRMLRSLFQAGVELDPDLPPTKAQSQHDRYDRLPALLSAV